MENVVKTILDGMTFLTNLAVLSGVFLAYSWRKDYKEQCSHEYALGVLKKVKILHHEIDLLRRAKFYNPTTIVNDIEEKLIPEIEDKIIKKAIEIHTELLVASLSLTKHKNLKSVFEKTILKNVIHHIRKSITLFFLTKSDHDFEIKRCELFELIFPFEKQKNVNDIIHSELAYGVEIMNDEFNKTIQSNFKTVYDSLEENLIKKDDTQY